MSVAQSSSEEVPSPTPAVVPSGWTTTYHDHGELLWAVGLSVGAMSGGMGLLGFLPALFVLPALFGPKPLEALEVLATLLGVSVPLLGVTVVALGGPAYARRVYLREAHLPGVEAYFAEQRVRRRKLAEKTMLREAEQREAARQRAEEAKQKRAEAQAAFDLRKAELEAGALFSDATVTFLGGHAGVVAAETGLLVISADELRWATSDAQHRFSFPIRSILRIHRSTEVVNLPSFTNLAVAGATGVAVRSGGPRSYATMLVITIQSSAGGEKELIWHWSYAVQKLVAERQCALAANTIGSLI